jgi:GTP cyclohydrolase II
MTHINLRDETLSPRLPHEGVAAGRAVHRAAAELRRGTPVLFVEAAAWVVLAAETADARGLAELAALAADAPLLLLAPGRAARLLGRPIAGAAPLALPLARGPLDPARLRALADPTVEPPPPTELPVPVAAPTVAAAALTLAKLARLLPAAIVAPARPTAEARARDLGLLALAVSDILAYPDAMAAALTRVAEAAVPLADAADARLIAFRGPEGGAEHLAILIGRPEAAAAPLVRIHSECFTGDLLGSLRCDCGAQLQAAIRRIAAEGDGVLLYLAQEGRGIGLAGKLRAYALQDRGLDTLDANQALGWEADERNFLTAATMLMELGINRVRLLTNNPEKVAALAVCGIHVAREAHAMAPNGVNDRYLATKAARFGHLLG